MKIPLKSFIFLFSSLFPRHPPPLSQKFNIHLGRLLLINVINLFLILRNSQMRTQFNLLRTYLITCVLLLFLVRFFSLPGFINVEGFRVWRFCLCSYGEANRGRWSFKRSINNNTHFTIPINKSSTNHDIIPTTTKNMCTYHMIFAVSRSPSFSFFLENLTGFLFYLNLYETGRCWRVNDPIWPRNLATYSKWFRKGFNRYTSN